MIYTYIWLPCDDLWMHYVYDVMDVQWHDAIMDNKYNVMYDFLLYYATDMYMKYDVC